jgi:hypothetical protein
MATDLRPDHLDRMTSTIGSDELPQAFHALLNGTVRGCLVADLG